MKKRRKLLIVFISTVLLLFSACGDTQALQSSDTPLICQTLGTPNNGMDLSAIEAAEENSYWNGIGYRSKTAKQNLTVSLASEVYSGMYEDSRYEIYHSYVTDYYWGEDGLRFGVNAETGDVVYLNLQTKSFYETEPYLADLPNVEETTLEIAREFAKFFIPVDEYEEIEPRMKEYVTQDNVTLVFYQYTFAKLLNGEKTTDYVTVQVSSKGHLASIVVGDPWAFSDISDAQLERLKSVDAVQVISDAASAQDSIAVGVQSKGYAVTPDGELVLWVRAECVVDPLESVPDEEALSESGLFSFIIR